MLKILVCDDEEGIRTLISKYARFEGYEVECAKNGAQAIELCQSENFDVLIVDIMMPDLDGFCTTMEIRKFSDIPIIMLTARGEEYDRIHGFEVGADDYVVKPFSPKELMMRVDVIMRRTSSMLQNEHETYINEDMIIDFTARKVIIEGKEIELAPKEYDLLFYIAKNSGIALSREKLLANIWGYDLRGDDRTLDTHIKLLRRHMGKYGRMIITLRGIGYRFEG